MKKILALLGTVGLIATTSTTAIACVPPKTPKIIKTPNLDSLKAEIAKAKKNQQGLKTFTAFSKLQQTIIIADFFVAVQTAIITRGGEESKDEIAEMKAILKTAIEEFNNSPQENDILI
ncbi:lipoprotein [Mesoplasma seiffertii]|uniref:lipoprotein n=1 Tax=Mesoplasma seiffertii TaxID=28224 RepID=UPI00047C24AD|nr:lipoprotein [Mesoplasma seiffertii]